MYIEIPVNTKAKVHVPTAKFSGIREGNKNIAKVPSIRVLESNKRETILEIGPGTYAFSIKVVQ